MINSLSPQLVARMFADYQRLGLLKTARLHGRAGATIYGLLRRRGLITSRKPTPERVARMYADYVAGLSLRKVGIKYDRTGQAVYDLFKVRGLKLRRKTFLPAIEYNGRKYTSQTTRGRHRYLRDTSQRRNGRVRTVFLHHVIWEEHNGPVPRGYKVCFVDGNHLNCAIDNLELLTNSAQSSKHATGANQFTKSAITRLDLLLNRSGELATQLKERAA
jgi:hypothetical protein